MDLGLVVVSWNVRDFLAACLESAYADAQRSGMAAEAWVVDNASADGSADLVQRRFPQARLIRNQSNRGFAAANNQALRAMGFTLGSRPKAKGSSVQARSATRNSPFAVLHLNPDTVVKPGALRTLVDFMHATPAAGVAGARLLNPDGSPQECAFEFPGLGQAVLDLFPPPGPLRRLTASRLNGRYPPQRFERGEAFRIGHPLGAAFMARGQAIAEVGLMDEGYHMYCEEIDWVWRMRRAGWLAYCVPAAQVVHYGGQSAAQVKDEAYVNLWRSRKRLYETHRSRWTAWVVGRLVRAAMNRRARAAGAHQRAPYYEIARLWR